MAGDAVLVEDAALNPSVYHSKPGSAVEFNGSIYFAEGLPTTGRELWRTQGTPESTQLAVDLLPGIEGSNPEDLTVVGDSLYFTAEYGGRGRELWKTDGTAAGTRLVVDINPTGSGFQTFQGLGSNYLTDVNGTLYFVADDGVHGSELWKTNGTAASTVRLTDINPGEEDAYIQRLTKVGDKLFFTARVGSGDYLFVTDGTAEGTVKLLGEPHAVPWPDNLVDLNGTLFFGRRGTPSALWQSDGTVAGTRELRTASGDPLSARYLQVVSGTLFFRNYSTEHGNELWRTDGTPAGTSLVKDIVPGSESSNPTRMVDVDGTLFFTTDVRVDVHTWDQELWKSDGTAAGTVRVVDPTDTPDGRIAQLVSHAGRAFFTAGDYWSNAYHLWSSDGTAVGTRLVEYGWFEILSAGLGSDVYMLRPTSGDLRGELWKSDGTVEGTDLAFRAPTGTDNAKTHQLTNVDGSLWYAAANSLRRFDPLTGRSVYVARASTYNVNGQSIHEIVGRGDDVFFTSGGSTRQLYTTAGERDSERLLHSGDASLLTSVGDHVYFTSGFGEGLWATDGTSPAAQVVDINPNGLDQLSGLVNVGGTLYFAADDGASGVELWRSDGTAAGTSRVAEIAAGGASSTPRHLTNVNGTLFFVADDGRTGAELWKFDGTTAVRVRDIALGAAGSSPNYLTSVGGELYFEADDGARGRELWKSDGVRTVMLRDIVSGSEGSNPREITASGGRVFFTVGSAAATRELWSTDGTTAGTRLVKDIWRGSRGSNPQFLTDVDGTLYFQATDGVHGEELWSSDGTAAGTRLAEDIAPIGGSAPQDLVEAGGRLFFSALTNETGRELWRTLAPALPPELILPGISIYAEYDPPVAIAPEALAFDLDQDSFAGGSLVVEVSAGGGVSDVLSVLEINGLTVEGDTVFASGVAVATLSGGSDDLPLSLVFTENATEAMAQLLVRGIGFAAQGDNPATDTRTISFSLNDGVSATVRQATTTVLVRQEDSPPLFFLSGDPPSVYEDSREVILPGFVADASPSGIVYEVVSNTASHLFELPPTISADGTLRYKPAANAFGVADISVRAVAGTLASEPRTFRIQIDAVSDRPLLTLGVESLRYTKNAPPMLLFPGAVVTDVDSDRFQNLAVSVFNRSSFDVFSLQNTGNGPGQLSFAQGRFYYEGVEIGSGGFSPGSLNVYLNSNAGLEAVQALLRSLAYEYTDPAPWWPARNVSVYLSDASSAASSVQVPLTIVDSVPPGEHAPRLDTSANVVIHTTAEDWPFGGAQLVRELISGAFTDEDPDARRGIAVTGLTHTNHGRWQYSADGSKWYDFGSVSATAARLLPADANTLVRFWANRDFHGTPRMYYRAWDQTQGIAGETFDITGQGVGGQTAFSAELEIGTVIIAPVDDSPFLNPRQGGSIGYTRGTPAVRLLASATVFDPDPSPFAGGKLIVRFTQGHHATNRLVIGGGFVLEGNNLMLNGVLIGTRNEGGGEGTTRLEISFNENSTRGIVQRLVRGIKFRTHGPTNTAQRAVEFSLVDSEGTVSNPVTIRVNVG